MDFHGFKVVCCLFVSPEITLSNLEISPSFVNSLYSFSHLLSQCHDASCLTLKPSGCVTKSQRGTLQGCGGENVAFNAE